MLVATPNKVTDQVTLFCAEIAPLSSPTFLHVQPAPNAMALECFDNVKGKVSLNGGEMQYGWRIWVWPEVMIEAEFHAVWKSPEGEFVDITPCDERTVLFLPDNSLSYSGLSVNNIRKALSTDTDIQEFVKITHDISQLMVKQRANPTRDNYVIVAALLPQMADRQEFLADKIAKRYPFPDGRKRARLP